LLRRASKGVSSTDTGVSSTDTGVSITGICVSYTDPGVSSADGGVSSAVTCVSCTGICVSYTDASVSSADGVCLAMPRVCLVLKQCVPPPAQAVRVAAGVHRRHGAAAVCLALTPCV